MLNLHLPHEAPLLHAAHNEVLLVSNADLRESANVQCWPVEEKFGHNLQQALSEHFGVTVRRACGTGADTEHHGVRCGRPGRAVAEAAQLLPDRKSVV